MQSEGLLRKMVKSAGAFIWVVSILTGPVLAAAPATVKVGTVIPLTGAMASGGKDVRAGYEIALKHINDAGGVFVKEFGKRIPLELVMVDDESDAVKTATRMDKLFSVDQVVAYLGGFSSDLNVVGMSTAEKNKVPWIGVTIAVEAMFKKGFRNVFAPFPMSSDQVGSFFDLLESVPKDLRPRKLAHLELQVDWGKECGVHLKELAKQKGYSVVVDQKYSPPTKDFSSLILDMKSAGAEVVFSVPTPPQSILIVKQMKELNYPPKVTCFIRGPDLSTYGDALGKDANYVISGLGWDESMPYPGNEKLVKDYFARHPDIKTIGKPVGSAYTSVQVLANAIERAGTLDREKIRDAIASTNMMTVSGQMRFRENGTAIMKHGFLQWMDGKSNLVWPKEIAKSQFLLAPPWEKR